MRGQLGLREMPTSEIVYTGITKEVDPKLRDLITRPFFCHLATGRVHATLGPLFVTIPENVCAYSYHCSESCQGLRQRVLLRQEVGGRVASVVGHLAHPLIVFCK